MPDPLSPQPLILQLPSPFKSQQYHIPMHRNRNNQDFDDFMIDQEDTYKRPPQKAKPKEDEFNFLDDQEDIQPLKLPVIRQDKVYQPPSKPKSRQRDSFNNQQRPHFAEVEEDRPSTKSRNRKSKQEKERGLYHEERSQERTPEQSQEYSNGVGKDGNEYENDFDDYENDFEEQEVEEVVEKRQYQQRVEKKQEPKAKEQPSKALTSKNIPVNKSLSVVKNKIEVRPKQTSLYRSDSRKSIKSGRTNLSLRKAVDNSKEQERKFSKRVEKSFSDVVVEKQKADEIEKMNERARAMVRELNTQLNQILNKVTLQQKKPGVQKKNVEDTIKLLLETKKNNSKILERGLVELKRLKERAGSVKDEEYQMRVTAEINSLVERKRETEKSITQMKTGYNIIEKKTATISKATIQGLKSNLIHLRKEAEKNENKDEELRLKQETLEGKTEKVARRHREVIEKANDKGIEIESTAGIVAKLKELEERERNMRKNVENTINLYKTKADITSNQNQRIKRDIVNCESQVKDIYSQIVDLAAKSSALIEREKENPKLMRNVLHSLEAFSKSIANPPPIFEGITSYDVNSPAGSSHRRNKNSSKLSNNDSEVSSAKTPSREMEAEKSPIKPLKEEEKNSFKPNFRKQKHQEERGEEVKQVVQEVEKEVEKTKAVVNNLKPTFNFRRKQENREEGGDKEKEKEEPVRQSPVQTHKVPVAAPTLSEQPVNKPFTRFRRNVNQQSYALTQPQEQKSENKIEPAPAEPVEPAQPKRFMLKRRGNQEDGESGYNPTVQKNVETRQVSQISEPEEQKNGFKDSPPSNQHQSPLYKPTSYQPSEPLKYEPTTVESNPPPRLRNFSNRPKQPQPSYSFNPTPPSPPQQKAPPTPPPKPAFQPKQRQGRVKKQRINLQPQKKGGNIYSHAQDLTNQFMGKEEPQPIENKSNQFNLGNARINKLEDQEMDLNKLIGNSKRRSDEDDDLVFQEKKTGGREKEKEKRDRQSHQNDFFGFDL